MYSEERKKLIIQILKELEKISVPSLANKFNVSEATIRRDLDDLSSKGLIIRTHGGALSKSDFELISVNERKFLNMVQKKAIARDALKLIKDNDNIFLSGGSTILELAKLLDSFEDLNVITNSIDSSLELTKFQNVETTIIGGTLWKKNLFTIGPLALKNLDDFQINKLFFGISGFDLEIGLTAPSVLEAEIISKIISKSKIKYLLADSSKYGKIFLSKVVPLASIDVIITDDKLNPDVVEKIENMGVEVLTVSVNKARKL
jgi:DeoR/GlpR family transcriptional regulator of sugar metabolism